MLIWHHVLLSWQCLYLWYNYDDSGVWLAFGFCFLLFVCADGGWSWDHWWSPQFLHFGFFHFVLDGFNVQLSFCRGCDVAEWEEVSSAFKVNSFRDACTTTSFFSLPLVVFFSKGFSLGGMKALLRSSCFLLRASACFTWERATMSTFPRCHYDEADDSRH